MATYYAVIEKTTGDLLRCGYQDFSASSEFDSGTEEQRTDLPQPGKRRGALRHDEFHRWTGTEWVLISKGIPIPGNKLVHRVESFSGYRVSEIKWYQFSGFSGFSGLGKIDSYDYSSTNNVIGYSTCRVDDMGGMYGLEKGVRGGTPLFLPLIAMVDPTADDDETIGCIVGSTWVNDSSGEAFTCVDSAIGAAVWKSTTEQGQGPSGFSGTSGTSGFSGTSGISGFSGDVGSSIFGSEFQHVEDEAQNTTTSSTFQQKIRLTTPSLPSGTYRIGWYCNFGSSTYSDRTEVQVELDDATQLGFSLQEPDHDLNELVFSGFRYRTLSGVHTIDMDYRMAEDATARISHARLEIWRIS